MATSRKLPVRPIEAQGLLIDAKSLIEEAMEKLDKAKACNQSLSDYYGYSIDLIKDALSESIYGRRHMSGLEDIIETANDKWNTDGSVDDDEDDED